MMCKPRIQIGILASALMLVACEKAPETAPPAAEEPVVDVAAELNQLYHEYDEEMLALNPISATFRGDHRFNDTFGPYDWLSDEYAEAMYDLHTRYLARLLEYDPEQLDGQDRLNYEIFQFDRENAIEREDAYNEFIRDKQAVEKLMQDIAEEIQREEVARVKKKEGAKITLMTYIVSVKAVKD